MTGTRWVGAGLASGPDRSIVRTVRGASGLDTYVGTVIGTGSQSVPSFAFRCGRCASARRLANRGRSPSG